MRQEIHFMQFQKVKEKLISFFTFEKLNGKEGSEWGFNNEIDRSVTKIGYATNLTPETVNEAIKHHVDLVITHHDAWPFLYGMKEKCHTLLKENRISHAFFHAPLDDAEFGTSSALADALRLTNPYKVIPYEELYLAGVIGTLQEPAPFAQLKKDLSAILCEPVRAFKNNYKLVSRICVTTGAGNMTTDIKIAVDHNCDTYVTGEYGLYSQQYAKFAGINLMVGSHTNTEILGVFQLVSKLIENTALEAVRLTEENY